MRSLALVGAFFALAGSVFGACDNQIAGDHQLTSLRMNLTSPTENELGVPGQTVAPANMKFSVDALDERGQLWASDAEVQAFLVAGGIRLPLKDPCDASTAASTDPNWLLSRFSLAKGHAANVSLPFSTPAIFGRLTLNIEDPVSQAAGATPPIFFPNPTISRLVKPLNLGATNATYCSPFLGRQIIVDGTAMPTGKLIVSSLFQNALAISDTSAPEYGSIYVFTFSRPPTSFAKGRIVDRFAGAVAKFNGMTQVANPTLDPGSEVRTDLLPPYVELDATRRPTPTVTSAENQWLTRYIAAPVRITGVVCETTKDQTRSDNWIKYNTVVLNQTGDGSAESVSGCGGVNSSSYVPPTRFSVQFPGKGVGDFDPAIQAGKEVTITGMLQNSASKSGKTLYWTVSVRDQTDVCLLPRAMCPNAQ